MCKSVDVESATVLQLRFAKLDPSGNVTVIVLDPIASSLCAQVAAQIMGRQGLGAEQVGFVTNARNPKALAHLNMMGGEFCGNAARAFAAYLAFTDYPGIVWRNGKGEVPIEISGYDGVLTAQVSMSSNEIASAYVTSPMPKPIAVRCMDFGQHRLALVKFEGISHAVAWDLEPSEETFNKIMSVGSGPNDAAFGVMFFSEDTSKVVPLVAVRNTESLVWEGSCASGTVAVACAVAFRDRRSVELRLSQPGGALDVNVKWDKGIVNTRVGGRVDMIASGRLFVRLPRSLEA